MLYYCDPKLNTKCTKENCFMNDGACTSTTNSAYAKQPITTVRMIVDKEDFADAMGGE